MRRGLFSGREGPRVADSTFILSRILSAGGKHVLAAKLVRDVVEMCGDLPEMTGHLARALWFLAQAERETGQDATAGVIKAHAKQARERMPSCEGSAEDSDDGFMSLVTWMLW